MIIIRPIREEDLDRLFELASTVAGGGMTTLPADRGALAAKIASSVSSFSTAISEPGPEAYMLVLEDTETGAVGGTAAVYARIGIDKAFYSYKLTKTSHMSVELGVYKTHEVLHLVNDYLGYAEVGTLYVAPEFRRDQNGRTLARSRYLLMADHRDRFPEDAVAEMRGWQDEAGQTPFWDALGAKFFDMSFHQADHLSAVGNNQFIADLMPKFPVYVDLLPEEAQAVIGKAHEDAAPALHMLFQENFRYKGHVDIFDAGPTVEAPIDSIKTVRDSQKAVVAQIIKDDAAQEDPHFRLDLVSAGRNAAFRVTRALVRVLDNETVAINESALDGLGIGEGDQIRHIALRDET
ncbi:MAG: arginine N-succinyltransferase [Alphaproteobacteria bacterium]|nr:MAG: arginine N-succinyltransferase [Alphaproteobacteria bacterium]